MQPDPHSSVDASAATGRGRLQPVEPMQPSASAVDTSRVSLHEAMQAPSPPQALPMSQDRALSIEPDLQPAATAAEEKQPAPSPVTTPVKPVASPSASASKSTQPTGAPAGASRRFPRPRSLKAQTASAPTPRPKGPPSQNRADVPVISPAQQAAPAGASKTINEAGRQARESQLCAAALHA